MTRLPRRPLVGVALCFIIGISTGLTHPAPPAVLLPTMAACLALAAVMNGGRHPVVSTLSTLLVLAAVLGLGWAHASLNHPLAPEITISAAGSKAGAIGVVADEPVRVEQPGKRPAWSFPLDVARFRGDSASAWRDASGTVRVRLFAAPTTRIPAYGESWSVSGRLDQPVFKQGRMTGKPAGFYLTTSGSQSHFLSNGHGNALTRHCLAARAWAALLLKRGIEDYPEQVTILNSLLLGYYSRIPRDLYQAFAATGTLHVFAISGSQ